MSVPADASLVCIKSLVFFDLETTGLPSDHAARITELNFCGVDRSQFIECKTKKIPRVTNRLNLCIDPSRPIDPVATTITKLDNANLGQQSKFDGNVFNIIVSFLERYFFVFVYRYSCQLILFYF
jgi:DNA polymerase III epsilon subunit-like protein